jgi:hypothetical protein
MATPLYNTDIIPLTSRPTLTVMDDGDYFVILDTSTGKISKILKTNLVLPASQVSYDNATSGLTATQVQAALDELVVNLGSSDSAISALGGRLDILEADESTEGSVAYDIKQSSDALKGAGYTEGTLKTHEDRLDTLEGTGAGSVAKAIDDALESIETDKTLTVSGAAADAKVTGDKVGELKSAIDSQDGIINVTKTLPLGSGYYTLETAVAAVYSSLHDYVTKGRIITFATSLTEWQTWQCRVLDNTIIESSWKNLQNWFKVNKTTKQAIVIAAYDSSTEAKQNADLWTNSENDGIKLINDAIAILPTGGRIYLRDGTYKGGNGVAVSVNNLTIEGETQNVTISRTSGSDIILTSGVTGITLKNLTFDAIAVPSGTSEPQYRDCIFGTTVRNNLGNAYDYYIAAYDSTDSAKRAADYVCASDTDFGATLNRYIGYLTNGGTIKLAAGTYNSTTVIDLNGKSNISIIGDGHNTKLVRNTTNVVRANADTNNCLLQGLNFNASITFPKESGKMLNCWIGSRYIDIFPMVSGAVYVDPTKGIEGINEAIVSLGVGDTGGKIVLGIGTYTNISGTSAVSFYKSSSPTGYINNVMIEGQGRHTVISRSTGVNDIVATSASLKGCVVKAVSVAHNVQRTVGNPVSMCRLIECYIAERYVDESSEGMINAVNVGKGRYFETVNDAYDMFYANSYPISETQRWEIHVWGYVLETKALSISKNRIDLIGHNALIELRGKGDVRANFADQLDDYYGPGLEINVRDIHFKKTGCYNYYQNYCVYVASDNVRFFNCIFENASSSPTPFDQRDYLESQEATAGARRHGIGIECKKWGSQCKTEFHNCIGIGSPYGFMNTRGWYIVFGSPKLYDCIGYGGGIGEFCHGIINHRSSQAELFGCIGYASKTAFRKSAGIRFQAAASSHLHGCVGYGSGGEKYISEGVSAERVTEICTALGVDPSTYIIDGEVQYSSLTDAICAEISNDDITLTPLNANTEEGYGISFWTNDGTAKLLNCSGYVGSGENSHGLHVIGQAKPTVIGGYFGINDMLQNIAVVSNSGNDMVTQIGGELNSYSKYTVTQITLSVIGSATTYDDLLYVETTEDTPQTIVDGYNLKNVSSIAIAPTTETTVAAGKGLKIYIKRNGSKIAIAENKYLMHVQYNYAGDNSSAVYIGASADPLVTNAIIRAASGCDALEIADGYTNDVRMFDCAMHGNVDNGIEFAEKTAVNSSSNYVI